MVFTYVVGVDDAELDRVPWVSLLVSALCAAMFALTWLFPTNPMGTSGDDFRQVFQLWEKHPNAALPKPFLDLLEPEVARFLTDAHAKAVAERGPAKAEDQLALRDLAERVVRKTEGSFLRRLGLVPGRGFDQVGWLTYMFLHGGWLHLLGNLFLLFLTAPLLEDRWGRPLFAAFYLAGGAAAGLAQVLLDVHSLTPIIGASGAVAACIGAFAYRFAQQRIRIGYFFWITLGLRRGTFTMPAWSAGGLWFAGELLTLALGTAQGVAVMAHVGGFLVGLLFATVLRTSGIEDRFILPALLRRTGNLIRPAGLDEAAVALTSGNLQRARRLLGKVLRAYPAHPEALLLLVRLERSAGMPDACARLERFFDRLLAQERVDLMVAALEQLGSDFDPSALQPATAFRLAVALEADPVVPTATRDALYAVAATDPAPFGAHALLQRAELAREQRQPRVARDLLAQLAGRRGVDPETRRQAAELEAELGALAPAPGELSRPPSIAPLTPVAPVAGAPAPVPRVPVPPPRIIPGRVLDQSPSALVLQLGATERKQLDYARILGVAVGLAPHAVGGSAPPRVLPVTDLVLRWADAQQGALVLRLDMLHLGLGERFPGVPAREAYGRWLRDVVERAAGAVLPERAAVLRGEYPRFASAEAMSQALYAVAGPPAPPVAGAPSGQG